MTKKWLNLDSSKKFPPNIIPTHISMNVYQAHPSLNFYRWLALRFLSVQNRILFIFILPAAVLDTE